MSEATTKPRELWTTHLPTDHAERIDRLFILAREQAQQISALALDTQAGGAALAQYSYAAGAASPAAFVEEIARMMIQQAQQVRALASEAGAAYTILRQIAQEAHETGAEINRRRGFSIATITANATVEATQQIYKAAESAKDTTEGKTRRCDHEILKLHRRLEERDESHPALAILAAYLDADAAE